MDTTSVASQNGYVSTTTSKIASSERRRPVIDLEAAERAARERLAVRAEHPCMSLRGLRTGGRGR